jgi:uncharacterized membrane protein YqaE (UPF0057 family)
MFYVLAIFLPPLAPLFKGKFGAFLLNCLLTLCGFIPGVIHACVVVHQSNSKKRIQEMATAFAQANNKAL